MTPGLLLAWSIATDGLLARAELRADVRAIEAHPLLVDHLVTSAASHAAGQSGGTGLHVAGGCGRRDCVVVVEGLAAAVPLGQAAVEQALTSMPQLGCRERRGMRRAWRGRPFTPGLVLEAALARAVGDPSAAQVDRASERLDLRAPAIALASRRLREGFGSDPVAPAPPPPPRASPTPARTWVDWPGATRVQVAVAWASSGAGEDLVRDATLAGDFESLFVQALREDGGLTYDVEPDQGEGWAAAVFDVAAGDLSAALTSSALVLSVPLDQLPGRLAGAHLRLLARHAAARDSLAGQLAPLPEVPPSPPTALARASVLAWVAVGDPEMAPGAWTRVSRCETVGDRACPGLRMWARAVGARVVASVK
ncbi:MAG: hypothetical protein FJ090_16325 [Deltaproteobacteria bacterium]|nr:hypothetical protein [Deltaproteobacteria bacterium]